MFLQCKKMNVLYLKINQHVFIWEGKKYLPINLTYSVKQNIRKLGFCFLCLLVVSPCLPVLEKCPDVSDSKRLLHHIWPEPSACFPDSRWPSLHRCDHLWSWWHQNDITNMTSRSLCRVTLVFEWGYRASVRSCLWYSRALAYSFR